MSKSPDEQDNSDLEGSQNDNDAPLLNGIELDSVNDESRRRRMRKRVREIVSYAVPMPQAVAAVLRDATMRAVDMAVEEVANRRTNGTGNVPGDPVVRVERAPENSRRIFAGIDIMASVDDVWKLLTDYENLQNVIPNLVVNDVMEMYIPSPSLVVDSSQSEEAQCQQLANQMKGALLRQVGGAKVAGINFSARTKLEVREWPSGLPDFDHFRDEVWEGKSRKERAKDYAKVKLTRYHFPRPFAVSALPTRDISMQSIEKDDGEFRMYQGVWRMQPLPGCAPAGKQAMRLTYAVEVSPRAYLPVALIERRIAQDLCTNLVAIRDYVAGGVPAS
jgi:hypothetical protein